MKKNVVIIGLGLIGGSLAKAFQKYSDMQRQRDGPRPGRLGMQP